MHELAICQALIDQVETIVRVRRARRALSIVVRVGPLAGVEPELLRSAYPLASAGTLAADATLVLEQSSVCVRCLECNAESEVESNRLVCPLCGQWHTKVVTGEELLLMSVELEKEIADHV
jgi:hydrogenase nickel incorporation protein HypA/HybF